MSLTAETMVLTPEKEPSTPTEPAADRRADVEAKQGKTFTLKRFHDDFMQQGFAPIKIVRHAMLKDDTPAL